MPDVDSPARILVGPDLPIRHTFHSLLTGESHIGSDVKSGRHVGDAAPPKSEISTDHSGKLSPVGLIADHLDHTALLLDGDGSDHLLQERVSLQVMSHRATLKPESEE